MSALRLRRQLGALYHDLPRALLALRPGRDPERAPWQHVHNRDERLLPAPDGRGVSCAWRWTSDLHAAHVFPWYGRALLRRALRDWPLRWAQAPVGGGPPEVAFLIGHRGGERLPLLLAVLASIAGQQDARVECVVVEQAERPEAAAALPPWVRHVHTPLPWPDMPYSRGWALNVAARCARAPLLVLHDGDILVPAHYARQLLREQARGAQVVDLKRFLFELSREQTAALLAAEPGWERGARRGALERVRQNARGGTLAVSRAAFLELGGFDETFVGWGGEDHEFWERAATLASQPYGYLPFVHLWHSAQPEKLLPSGPPGRRLYEERQAQPVQQRIARLRSLPFGSTAGPCTDGHGPRPPQAP